MRSPLALTFIGCVFSPKAALGRLPIYIYRAPPTSSPTSSPSYQPSFRPSWQPSSKPSSSPSYQPSSHPTSNPSISLNPSFSPSYEPTSQPSTNPDASSVSSSFMMNPEAMSKPFSLVHWLSISLICVLLFFVGAWLHCVRKKKKKQCLPCFVARGDKTSQDKVEDKVQEKQSDEKQNDEKQNDALRPAKGDDDGWTAVLSPVLAVGGFLSSVVSPAPPQEELSPEEPSNPPSPVVKKGGFLSSLVSSAWNREELSPEEPSNQTSVVVQKKSSSLFNFRNSDAQVPQSFSIRSGASSAASEGSSSLSSGASSVADSEFKSDSSRV